MVEKISELIGREFLVYAKQRRSRGSTRSAVTVARVAGLSLEDSLPFGGQRVCEGHIGGSERRRRQFRVERFARVFVLVGLLLGQLLGHSRVVPIQILAAKT